MRPTVDSRCAFVVGGAASWTPLNELHPVAERISELKSISAGYRHAIEYLNAVRGQKRTPSFQVRNGVSDMGLGRQSVHSLFHSDMELAVSDLEPETTAPFEDVGFFNLGQAKQRAVKGASLFLRSGRYRDL